jgi:hypothetical protein
MLIANRNVAFGSKLAAAEETDPAEPLGVAEPLGELAEFADEGPDEPVDAADDVGVEPDPEPLPELDPSLEQADAMRIGTHTSPARARRNFFDFMYSSDVGSNGKSVAGGGAARRDLMARRQ